MPRLAEVELQCRPDDVEAQQREEVPSKEGQEGCEEELAARDERQCRVAEVRDVDVLEAGDEEESAGVNG